VAIRSKVAGGRKATATRAMRPGQLRRLQAAWRRWAGRLELSERADRTLRHYYVGLFSEGRARETRELSEADARRVIRWLERLAGSRQPARNLARGTAGRHGFPERTRVAPDAAAWRVLWVHVGALGMDRERLDAFIRRHYGRLGLRGARDLTTMADLNRVLWGLKAMLRRRPPSLSARKKAA
jgi:hypothetical protein